MPGGWPFIRRERADKLWPGTIGNTHGAEKRKATMLGGMGGPVRQVFRGTSMGTLSIVEKCGIGNGGGVRLLGGLA